MARRTRLVTIPASPEGTPPEAKNRDAGKKFLITEMSPFKAEMWALRALNIIVKSGIEVPDSSMKAGMAGLASVTASGLSGFRGLDVDAMEPLLKEMLEQVSFVAGTEVMPLYRPLSEEAEDVAEVSTLLRLRREVLELHLGFSLAEKLRDFLARMKAEPPTNTETSRD